MTEAPEIVRWTCTRIQLIEAMQEFPGKPMPLDLLGSQADMILAQLPVLAGDPDSLAEASADSLPLPDGEYARVEIMGHDFHTGWVTEGNRAGQPVMVIRDWDGFVIAEVPGHSLYRFVPLATPLKRPEPQRALPHRTFAGAAMSGCLCGPDEECEDCADAEAPS